MRPIVLGVRNPIPPEGRITIEVRNARTGKLRRRVVDENAVMDWFSQAVSESLQYGEYHGAGSYYDLPSPYYTGPYDTSLLTGDPDSIAYDSLFELSRQGLTQLCHPGRTPLHQLSSLFLSDNTATIPAGEMFIPGTLTGASATRSVAPSSYNNKIGYHDPSNSYINLGLMHMEYVFPTDKANGTFQTVGYGSVIPDLRSAGNQNVVYPYLPMGMWRGSIPPSTLSNDWQWDFYDTFYNNNANSYIFVEGPGQVIARIGSSASVSVMNNKDWWFIASPIAQYTWSLPSSSNNFGFTTIGNTLYFFWLSNQWRTYGLPITSSTPTPTSGTFTGFTDSAILGASSNGVNTVYLLGQTKVFVMDSATKTITSSWSHGITQLSAVTDCRYAGIMYDIPNSRVLISYRDPSDIIFPLATSVGHLAGGKVDFFSPAGTPLSYNIHVLEAFNSATSWLSGGVCQHMRTNGQIIMSCRTGTGTTTHFQFLRNPNLKSAVVLDNPVTKTSDDEMRVAYEISFS